MALTTDEMRRVTYSRYLLERAGNLQARRTDLSSAEAILAAHDAAEMLMRVVYDRLKITPPNGFMEFWKLVRDSTGDEPLFKGKMKSLNDQRNEFKHGGHLLHSSTVEGLLASVAEFCEHIAQKYLQIDYNTATLAALIQNIDAREQFKMAAAKYAAGDIRGAIESVRQAFMDVYSEALKRHEQDLPRRLSWNVPSVRTGNSDIDRQVRGIIEDLDIPMIVERLNSVTEAVTMQIFNVDPVMYWKFVRLTPFAFRTFDGNTHFTWRSKETPSREDYEFCRSFVINFALQNGV